MELLIKTFKENDLQYARNLLHEGDLFFQNVKVFQGIEDNSIRGDANEGVAVEKFQTRIPANIKTVQFSGPQGKRYVLDLNMARRDIPELNSQDILGFQITYIVDWLIYCMTYINSGMENRDEVLASLKQFGKYCVVIMDCRDFLSKVDKAISCEKGLVRYSDTDKPGPFIKKMSYCTQSEFRLGINANGERNKLITIGGLKGFICDSSNVGIINHILGRK